MVIVDIAKMLEAQRSRQGYEGMVKIAEDVGRYRQVIESQRPDLIVECGTFSGKSARWFHTTGGCEVITIDTHPVAEWEWPRDDAITSIIGSSVDPLTVAYVHGRAHHRNVLVSLDSDHSASHVFAEMESYSPLVPVGGYMIVEDGVVRWLPNEPYEGSPLDAIEKFLAVHDEWTIARDIEHLFDITLFPSGWLRRVA